MGKGAAVAECLSHFLRRDIEEDVDYLLLPQAAWTLLTSWCVLVCVHICVCVFVCVVTRGEKTSVLSVRLVYTRLYVRVFVMCAFVSM